MSNSKDVRILHGRILLTGVCLCFQQTKRTRTQVPLVLLRSLFILSKYAKFQITSVLSAVTNSTKERHNVRKTRKIRIQQLVLTC